MSDSSDFGLGLFVYIRVMYIYKKIKNIKLKSIPKLGTFLVLTDILRDKGLVFRRRSY
jgi:hypothetical protein